MESTAETVSRIRHKGMRLRADQWERAEVTLVERELRKRLLKFLKKEIAADKVVYHGLVDFHRVNELPPRDVLLYATDGRVYKIHVERVEDAK